MDQLQGRLADARLYVASLALAALLAPVVGPANSSGATNAVHNSVPLRAASLTGHCPWISQSLRHSESPVRLANEVIARMSLIEKASFVILSAHSMLENSNSGVPALCIPPITLTDGPDGVANGLTGVTQFPAAIGIAASFDTSLARAVGRAQAIEARTKGLAVVQGPNLNLARVAQGGRIFETYGEDPFLTSVIGVADVNGIQSTGELANAKHISAYTQETARLRLNQIVSPRALAELYDAPFKAVVQRSHVASMMCSYGELNGVNSCSDPTLYAKLTSWGFNGFVRSDLGAVSNVAQAFRAGMSLIKPGSVQSIVRLVQHGSITVHELNHAVRSVLVPMFQFGLIAHPLVASPTVIATSSAHGRTALTAAIDSIVLLKNRGSILPLTKGDTTIAVIGADAGPSPQSTGGGSSKVHAPYVVSPLTAIRSLVGASKRVTYEPGGPPTLDLDRLSDVDIVKGTPLKLVKPIPPISEAGKSDIAIEKDPNVTAALATATAPGKGLGWDKWALTIKANRTGTYEITFQQDGDAWLYLNKSPLIASPGLHGRANMSATAQFTAGHRYEFSAHWFQLKNQPAPTFSLLDVTPLINKAVASARKAKIAIVFVGNFNSEGVDNPSLNLPGDANPLISAVSKVNPHTIVVLNTGGAVLMPWLSSVSGVLEAWYPGQEDGTAIARVLTGAVDPSGRLPLTFPASATQVPAVGASAFPGVNSTVNFGSGLGLGYRWYQMNNVAPLFPFGFGETYTTFGLSSASLRKTSTGFVVSVKVSNTGRVAGSDVVQTYVNYPASTNEPPEQLRAFDRVTLRPSESKRISMFVPSSALQIFRNNALTTVHGSYRLDVGESSTNLPIHLSASL